MLTLRCHRHRKGGPDGRDFAYRRLRGLACNQRQAVQRIAGGITLHALLHHPTKTHYQLVKPMKKEILHLTGLLAAAVFCSTVGAQTNFTLRPLTTPDFGGHGDGSIHPGDQPYVTGQSTTPYPGRDYQRGLAWDPATGNLILVDRHTGGASSTPYMTGNIEVLDGASGGGVGVLKIDGVDTNGQAILTNGDYVTCAAAGGEYGG